MTLAGGPSGGAGVTVSGTVSAAGPLVAVTAVVPAASPLTTPPAETVAMVGSITDQAITACPMTAPLESRATALS